MCQGERGEEKKNHLAEIRGGHFPPSIAFSRPTSGGEGGYGKGRRGKKKVIH